MEEKDSKRRKPKICKNFLERNHDQNWQEMTSPTRKLLGIWAIYQNGM